MIYKEEMEERTKERVLIESKSKGMKYFEKYYRQKKKRFGIRKQMSQRIRDYYK